MKKLIIAALALLSVSAASFAQAAPAARKSESVKSLAVKPTTGKKVKTEIVAANKASSAAPVAVAKTGDKNTTAKQAVKKGNHASSAIAKTSSASPTKKDGTPDMRYKKNKDLAANAATRHLKKDGAPDKRFKENKKKG